LPSFASRGSSSPRILQCTTKRERRHRLSPSLASFSFFLPLKSLTRGRGCAKKTGHSNAEEMRQSAVRDRAAKIWKGKRQISAGKRMFLCCFSLLPCSVSGSPASRQGKPMGRFQSTQPHHHHTIASRHSSPRVPRSQTGGVM